MNKEIIPLLKQFENADDHYSSRVLFTTLTLHLILTVLSCWSYSYHPLLSIIFWIPIGIILCRIFVLEHDAGHRSLFSKRTSNKFSGLILGFFTMIPSALWNHIHNVHHGVVGNLEERKRNPELWTMTCAEYRSASWQKKLGYRIMRSIVMRLMVTPALWILVPRIPLVHLGWKIFLSILIHNVIYGIILFFLIRNELFGAFVMIYLVPLYLFNLLASIFFYLQHQFEDTKWNRDDKWNLFDASIHGSSYLISNRLFTWISGNVGCHHVHHLNTRIPHYHLQKATAEIDPIVSMKPIYLKDLFYHLRCILYDEHTETLISMKSYHQRYIKAG